ncbi:hypothetical protein BBK36DRAFT_1165161 [Trichoderma citrinoviride]|uniref:Uncharacterized protein n=1 Tax=Trichoderma citrinoviride TaxID=58853 RepID=A0A2T4BN16_9HYPO|nr:hypothetical protein BBK36DRAFT_1165161 [Trichoderma citrinoviride]PTB70649.1 hypothetical protein BBK36DRAFT_1165161 [Trichoderma citrinoviride]
MSPSLTEETQQLKVLHHLLRDQRRNTSVGMSCERLYRADTFSAFWTPILSEVRLLRLHRRGLRKSTYAPSDILTSQLTVLFLRFMIPGVLNDDKYRMVEDEFLHVAQRFTAHLHRAEYDRLKALAKAQNADTIREIERPIVPDLLPTASTRQRRASRQRVLKQRKALAADGRGDEDRKAKGDGAKSPLAATGLRGLMEAPRREGRTIMPAVSASSASSRTRAAAGYSSKSLPQQDSRSREPSPSLPPLPSSVKRIKHEPLANSRTTSAPSGSTSQPSRGSHSDVQATSSPATRNLKETPREERKAPEQRPNVHVLDDDDDDLFGLHERMMSRKKSREQFKRSGAKSAIKDDSNTIDLTSIPSFL